MARHKIHCQFFSQESLLAAGCLDIRMSMAAAEEALRLYEEGDVIFPEKIVQIFNDETQERINCLPATFRKRKICGVKWVSVFPPNPVKYGIQNLSAAIILSEIEHGLPIAIMDGTLCSNVRVGTMGAVAAKYLARTDSKTIGFIGAGEQSKMHMIAMKTAVPSLEHCRVAAKYEAEEAQFIAEMSPILPGVTFEACNTELGKAVNGADIIVTATSAQAPLLKADWFKPGAFYSHVGGWEDEYAVAKQCDKIVCDDWETVKHRRRSAECIKTANWPTRTFTPTSSNLSQEKSRAAKAPMSGSISTPSGWRTSTSPSRSQCTNGEWSPAWDRILRCSRR